MLRPRKKRIVLRVFSGNRLTLPLLLNVWERDALDRHLDLVLVDAEPGSLSPAQAAFLQSSDACVYSFMTPHLPQVAAELKALRRAGRMAPLLVAGGPHISGEQELAASCGFDLLFSGGGEEAFLRFGQDLLGGKFVAGSGSLVFSMPDSGRNWDEYFPISRRFKTVPPLEITRGCFWKCRYCQTGGAKPHHRGEEAIAPYLEELRRRGMKRIGFISPSALEFGAARAGELVLERIESLLEASRKAGFRFIEYGIFPSEVRPDSVSAEALRMLRGRVANRRLTIGAQSAVDARLGAIGRGHLVADIESAVALANEAGFAPNLDFIIALPGETPEERKELLDLIARLRKKHRVFIQLHHFFPLAGSAFAFRKPSFLGDAEHEAFRALKMNGLASDWWLEGEQSVRAFLSWLQRDFPQFFSRFD